MKKIRKLGKLNKKASSLLEVMIVLGIMSSVLVVALNLIISSLTQIRRNESEDLANLVMLKSLEAAKSPTQIEISDNMPTIINSTYLYSLEVDTENDNLNYLKSRSSNISKCETNSEYYIDFAIPGVPDITKENICVVVQIIPRGTSKIDYYEINSIVYYLSNNKSYYNLIKGIRYGSFRSKT